MAKKRPYSIKRKSSSYPFWSFVLLVLLPLLVWAFYTRLYPYIKAATTQTPKYVRINPGQIRVPQSPPNPLYMSALAYDANDQPIYDGITYSWGMSSTTSVGTIQS